MARADVRAHVREEEHLVCERSDGVDDHRERVVVDHDELGRVDAVGSILGEDDGDDVTDEAHDLAREEGPHHPPLDAGDRRRREDCERDLSGRVGLRPGYGGDRRRIDLEDARVSVRRADERRVEGSRDVLVLDIEPLAPEEPVVLDAENPLAHDAAHGRTLSHTAGATPQDPPRPPATRGCQPVS